MWQQLSDFFNQLELDTWASSSGWQALRVLLVTALLAYLVEGAPRTNLTWTTIGALAYCSVFGTVAAYLLYYRILAAAGAGNLLLVTLMIPPVAILFGAWVRDESLTSNAYLGFSLLALGLLILDGRILRLFSTKD